MTAQARVAQLRSLANYTTQFCVRNANTLQLANAIDRHVLMHMGKAESPRLRIADEQLLQRLQDGIAHRGEVWDMRKVQGV